MTDLSKIPARRLMLVLSSSRKSLLAPAIPQDKVEECRAKVAAIRAELLSRGVTPSVLP